MTKIILSTAVFFSVCLLYGQNTQQIETTPATKTVQPPTIISPNDQPKQPHIQVVFALDATGSMSGLIGAAKQKIWSIAGSLAQAQPAPKIELGIIFYRDLGDDFITKRVDLSSDLDGIYSKLMAIQAQGGGDGPESVNQGLAEAVVDFKWDTDSSTYKTIFLIGDFPPHMDYANDIKYMESCRKAVKKDIIINTILMGSNSETERIWREISQCSGGAFIQMGMDANNFEVSTPYDKEIGELQHKIDSKRIYYGNSEVRKKSDDKLKTSDAIYMNSSPESNARRSEYMNTSSGSSSNFAGNELLNDVKLKNVKLDTLSASLLPEELKKMTVAERKIYVEKAIAERESLEKQLLALSLKRQETIDKELELKSKDEVAGSFNSQVYESIKDQAKKKNIKMGAKAKL
ncbi:MAG: VWA domain-containing protein [Bacteroidia bacterium]|nr:VWA domain-containing protein [Bacteroidia bacterium]